MRYQTLYPQATGQGRNRRFNCILAVEGPLRRQATPTTGHPEGCSIFSCDQAALWMLFSVHLSVCPSVCPSVTPFWLCSHHCIIMKFSEVITNDQSEVRAKGQGQRSKIKGTEVNTQLSPFRTVTPVWIHICTKLDVAYKRCPIVFQGHPSNFKVTWLNKSLIFTQIGRFRTVTPVWIHQWLRMMHNALSSMEEVPSCFSRSPVKLQGHAAQKSAILTQIGRFRTVTPVRIHWWLWNDAQSMKQLRRGASLLLQVVRQI